MNNHIAFLLVTSGSASNRGERRAENDSGAQVAAEFIGGIYGKEKTRNGGTDSK